MSKPYEKPHVIPVGEAILTELRAENAKLREFAQAMVEVAYEGQMLCDKCRFSNGCYNGGKKEHEGRGCQWLLWELGIEVEDDRR